MKKKNESGQTLIEFILAMILLLGFSFFFIQVGLTLAVGNYIQYATFMAARAYLSGGPSLQDQQQRATDVINEMLRSGGNDRFSFVVRGVGGGNLTPGLEIIEAGAGTAVQQDSERLMWMRGIRYRFRARMLALPLGGTPVSAPSNTGGATKSNEVDLSSESWLGRSPSDAECATFMGRFPNGGNLDNGC